MKACKISAHIHAHTHTHTHTRTYTHTYTQTQTHRRHTEADFLLQFALADHTGFFQSQMSKESLIVLSNVSFHAFTKLKQYDQLPENYNSSFKIYCEFAA